jgi:pimeloyl-ACP methyl ester carboxylesterase
MVTEEHLNYDSGKIYTKYYHTEKNDSLLVLIPGQSLSPRAFWDFKLESGKTHSEIFCEEGLDVLLIDPLGYGSSIWGGNISNYDRDYYAQQILFVCHQLEKQYRNKTIFGFSTSTTPAMIAAQSYFNKICLHSPAIMENSKRTADKFVPSGDVSDGLFTTNLESLKEKRLKAISDKLIVNPNRMDCWEDSLKEVIKTFTSYGENYSWSCPYGPIDDLLSYFPKHGTIGFDKTKLPKQILAIIGEYDTEVTDGDGYKGFKRQRIYHKEIVIPSSTHFSMWEKESAKTRAAMLKFCLTFIQ